jgi:hypothetical protein
LVRFWFFFLKSVWLIFLVKTEPNRKWSPLVNSSICLRRIGFFFFFHLSLYF